MSALDGLLAELAAAELAYREALRAERAAMPHTWERNEASYVVSLVDVRRQSALRAVTEFSLSWAAERAQSFITPANAQGLSVR